MDLSLCVNRRASGVDVPRLRPQQTTKGRFYIGFLHVSCVRHCFTSERAHSAFPRFTVPWTISESEIKKDIIYLVYLDATCSTNYCSRRDRNRSCVVVAVRGSLAKLRRCPKSLAETAVDIAVVVALRSETRKPEMKTREF